MNIYTQYIQMSSYSILIVDDEPDNFDVIEALLPSESYRLHYACCGEDALNALDKFDPDVILLDVMMPGIDGIEVCKRIKLMSQWQGVPIIMVTALSGKEDLARCLAAGADDFINKPVNGLELRARVNSMLRIKKQYDRIQSFSKLQRNNIHSLANNLNEIRLDLAVGFPTEFNLPLDRISANIKHLSEKIEQLSSIDTLQILESSNRSTLQLQKLTQKFWFYLQLLLEAPDFKSQGISMPKFIIEQHLTNRLAGLSSSIDVSCEVEDAVLAVNIKHSQWLFDELLNYLIDNCHSNARLIINGQIIDDSFHLSLSSCQGNNSASSSSEISNLIQFDPSSNEAQELEIGLKIVKKIIEMYDGIFLISGIDRKELTIYTTLPIVAVKTADENKFQSESPAISSSI
jgi:two-component system, sensor histidine kinase and response regulator